MEKISDFGGKEEFVNSVRSLVKRAGAIAGISFWLQYNCLGIGLRGD